MHLFYFCPHVVKFWISVQIWLKTMGIPFKITPIDIMLGVFQGNCVPVLNVIILLGKIFIFQADTIPSLCLKHFKNRIQHQYILEKIIATNNNKLSEHNKKWLVCAAELEI